MPHICITDFTTILISKEKAPYGSIKSKWFPREQTNLLH